LDAVLQQLGGFWEKGEIPRKKARNAKKGLDKAGDKV
jgi:hypothetical protein